MNLKDNIDLAKLPRHIAIIMDGNGRWARKRGNIRVFGHQSAIQAVRESAEAAAELGVEYLTLFAFSTENWSRPKMEVEALMRLLVQTIRQETHTLMENDIRLHAIGNVGQLPPKCQRELAEAIDLTRNNQRMTLTLALSYGSRYDITQAVKKLVEQALQGQILPADINEELLSNALSTAGIPEPELLIRTSGEYRISNFLLWEIAYSEIYFTPKLWPDFRKEDLYEAILDYQGRERRFGKISEQISK
ncbi:MAG: isoprenyl transferase [Bacteroidetes bacterium]|nr:MAG: isoprenyl transferase [Bacteroidota bacterium]